MKQMIMNIRFRNQIWNSFAIFLVYYDDFFALVFKLLRQFFLLFANNKRMIK